MHNMCDTETFRFRQHLTKRLLLLALNVAVLLLGTTGPTRTSAQSMRIRTSRQSRIAGNEAQSLLLWRAFAPS
jgi:hypothetical protein